MDLIFVGSRIRFFRKQKQLSQLALAELCDVHPTYIGQLERGEKNPSLETIGKVANGLDVSICELLGENIAHSHSCVQEFHDAFLLLPISEQERCAAIFLEILRMSAH